MHLVLFSFFSIIIFFFLAILFPTLLQRRYGIPGEKRLPLERGFWALSGGNTKFSLQFFTLIIIFVLFDIEVVLLSPLVFSYLRGYILFFLISFFIFTTLMLEWWWGKLSWFD